MRFNRTGEGGPGCATASSNAGLYAYNCVKVVSSYICVFKNMECPGDPTHESWTGSTCIGTYNELRNWLDARRACLEKGGDLFTLLPGYDGYGLGTTLADNEGAWVGLQRDVWQWIVPREGYQANETTPMEYWNWADGESSGDGEQCLYMDLQTRGKWRDKTCDYSNYFICENLLPQTITPIASPPPPPRPPSPRTVSQTTTTNNQMVSNGNPDTLSSTSAPSEGISSSSIAWIAVIAVLAFLVVIVVVGLVLKIRSTGSRVEILQREMTHLRRSDEEPFL